MPPEAELEYILLYAETIRQQILRGEKPDNWTVNRMAELANNIQREFDEQWQQWCDKHSCTE